MLAIYVAIVKLVPRLGEIISQWVVVALLWLLGSAYVYLAVLFGVAYYGIARLQSIQFTLPQALTVSVFIPALVGELPRNSPIMVLGAIQWILFAALGLGALLTYVRRMFSEFQSTATSVVEKLKDPQVVKVIQVNAERFRTPPPPPDSQPPSTVG